MKSISLGSTSAFVALVVMLATLSCAQSAEVKVDSFPDIIKHLTDGGQMRIISKVHWFERGDRTKMNTKLVDEAYSTGGKSSRMIVHDGIPTTRLDDLTMSLASVGNTTQQKNILVKCPVTVEVTPLEEGLILPEGILRDMLEFTSTLVGIKPIKLFGMGAIMANTIERHLNSLIKLEPKIDRKNEVNFKLDTGRGTEIMFRFTKKQMDRMLSIENMLELDVMIFKTGEQDDKMVKPMVAQLTTLKIQDQFKDKLLTIPEGHTCKRCDHCNIGDDCRHHGCILYCDNV